MGPTTPTGTLTTGPLRSAPGAVPAPREPARGTVTDDPGDLAGALAGPAWIMRAVTHVPGVLRLASGRLAFVSTRATLFDAPLEELDDLAFPWFGSSAFRVTVGDERLRVHVVRPSGAVVPEPAFLGRVLDAADGPATRGDAAAGPRWRAALERPTARSRGRR